MPPQPGGAPPPMPPPMPPMPPMGMGGHHMGGGPMGMMGPGGE